MNKNGVKLLAAVMALAMVFVAGFAFIGYSGDSNATPVVPTGDATSITANDVPVNGEIATAGSYKITDDRTVTIPGKVSSAIAITLYVAQGKTVTINGAAGTGSGDVTITVKPANAACNSAFDVDSYVTITAMTDGQIKVKTQAFGINGDNAKASTMYVSGTVTAGTVAGLAESDVQVALNETLSMTKTITLSNVNFGSSLSRAQETKTTYYPVESNVGSINIANGDVVILRNGSATISQGDNIVKIVGSAGTSSTNDITVTGTNGVPKIKGTLLGTSTTNKASLTIVSGVFQKDGTALAAGTNAVVNMVTAVGGTSGTYYSGQIVDAVNKTGLTFSGNVSYTVSGFITQKGSASPVTTSPGTTAATLTVSSGSTLVIDSGANVKIGEITSTGATVKVFGDLDCASVTSNTAKVGPQGYIHNGATKIDPAGNTNVKAEGIQESEIKGDYYGDLPQDVVLADPITIPAGETLTVSGNLGMNTKNIIVNGTLVISKGANIFGVGSEKIILAKTGKIVNEGTLGAIYGATVADNAAPTMSVAVKGVNGAQFGYDSDVLYVSGDITAIRNSPAKSITIGGIPGASIGNLTVPKDVELNVGAVGKIMKGSTVVINGTLKGTALAIGEAASLEVAGTADATGNDMVITIITGSYNTDTNKFEANETGNPTLTITAAGKATGFELYNKRVATTVNNETVYVMKAFVSGVLKNAGNAEATKPTVTIKVAPVTIESEFTVDKTATFAVSNSGSIVIEGALVIMNETSDRDVDDYVGAHYTVTPTAAGSETTGHYVTVDAAMDAIDTADDKQVVIKIATLDRNITVKDGQNVTIAVTGTVTTDAVFTAEDGSIVDVTIDTVYGMVVISGDSTANVNITNYASKKTSEDGTVTYAGFAAAVKNASPGDVITIGTARVGESDSRESLVIPAGVKVVVTETLTIYGNLTVPETAELVGGTVSVNGKDSSNLAEIKVAGKMDLSNRALSGTNKIVTSTGEIISQSKIAEMNGAYYQNTDGNYVFTTVSKALAADVSSVSVMGTYSESEAITLDGVNLVIDANANVTMGDITLVPGTKVTATGDLTANVIAKCGSDETTGAVSDATVKIVKSALTLESKKVTSASGVTTYTYTVNAIDGEMTIVEGTVTVNTAISSASADSKLTINDGAELVIAANVVIDGDKVTFVDDGKVTVKSEMTFQVTTPATGKVPVIAGTMDVADQGVVNASALKITGTLNVVKTAEENGTFNVTGTGVQVGSAMKSIGAEGSIVGPVNFASGAYYLLAFAGADMTEAIIDEASKKVTAYYVNDVLYVTAYTTQTVTITTPVTMSMLNMIDGVKDLTTLVWKDSNDTTVSSGNVGDKDVLYVSMEAATVDLRISVGSGISLYIDGVKYDNVRSYTVGEHSVQATVNPGYKGDVTITFNGQTVTNGKIVITSDMAGKNVVLSATGEISIDNGSTSGSSSSSDDGMGITDYLLIVLVVLAAVLVVIVTIRMMRS